MALRFIESFDHYTNTEHLGKWTSSSNLSTGITSGGRLGGNRLELAGGSTTRTISKTIDAQATWIVGFAWKIASFAQNTYLLEVRDGTTVHVRIGVNTSGFLYVAHGTGTVLGTAPEAISANVWYYIELKVLISDTGTWDLHVDGVSVTANSGDTRNAGNASANNFNLTNQGNGGGTQSWDDFYFCDGTGGSGITDTFLGDCRVEALYPNGNSATNPNVLMGSDSNTTDNYLLVDDGATPDSDSTYVESATVSNKDTYAFTNLTPATGTIYGIQELLYARKTDAGVRSIASIARHSGSEVDSANSPLQVTYNYAIDVRETKPGGGAWSVSDINGAEFGVKITA